MHDNWNKPNPSAPVILFATPPPLEALLALTVRVDHCSNTSFPGITMQPQVIKCREFIFTEPEVIGTPSLDPKDQCFHIVAQVPLLQSGKLQTRLSRVGLQVTKPYPVSPELYQSCLRYTLMARISPNWNKVGEWLVQGRDFLNHTGAVNAVKLDLSVNCDELYFTLEATALKISPLKVTDLDLYGNSMEKFLKHQIIEIDHERIASDWCYVLPSMKRGKIMSICHEIPEESPFMSYRDMKRYWKNTYGFRLPDSDEDMIFYQIHFGPLGGRLFTYPEVCLRARETQKVSRVDPKPILRDFMREITTKFPTICGAPMKLQSKAKFPLAWLFESGQNDPQTQPNLTNKMSARPSAYRSKDEMERLLSSRPDYSKPDFSASQMCSQTQTQSSNLPCSTTSIPGYKISNVPSVRQVQGSQLATPGRQLGFTHQNNNKHKREMTGHCISAPSSNKNYTTNSALSQKSVENRSFQQKPIETPSSTVQLNSPTPLNVNKISNCLSNCVQVPKVSSSFTSGIMYGKSCLSSEQTPSQGRFASQTGVKETDDSSVARKLIYPQFKPRSMPQISSSVNPPVSQVPFKPMFNVQKTSTTNIQRMSNILQVTAKSAPVPLPDSVKDKPVTAHTPYSVSFMNTPSSQPPQQPAKKVPLFFKKTVEKPVSTTQKSTGVKKTKSASASKDGKEKAAKGLKRNVKKDGEAKKKKMKTNPRLPEQ